LNAMRNVSPDHCVRVADLAPLLVRLATTEAPNVEPPSGDQMRPETEQFVDPPDMMQDPPPSESQISLVCPECGGTLYEQKDGEIVHFRYHVGHSFSPETLSEAHKEALERALWTAVRSLNERVTMHRQFLHRQRSAGEEILSKRFEESVAAAERDVELLREIISRV
ncbi:MAG TPA: hypothetical protein VK993_15560, partial [Chthoniobacterales bacterium]|nr:hypothetical protein [Chthoniobacterales bacterium]